MLEFILFVYFLIAFICWSIVLIVMLAVPFVLVAWGIVALVNASRD